MEPNEFAKSSHKIAGCVFVLPVVSALSRQS